MNQFVTSDEPLSPENYPIGSTLEDYANGKYVPLNAQQMQYLSGHPTASPEEVFEMGPLTHKINVQTEEDKMFSYYNNNCRFFYVNGQRYNLFDNRAVRDIAEIFLEKEREEFEIQLDGKVFKGTTAYILQMLKDIAVYYYDLDMAQFKHFKYLDLHPEERGTYDYTTNLPEVLSFTLQEVI